MVKLQERFKAERDSLRAQLPGKLERFMVSARKEGLCLDFSKTLDTLFVYLGTGARDSFSQELIPGVSAQFDPDDEELVGFEIENFSQAAAGGSTPVFQAFGSTYLTIVHYGKLVLPSGTDAPETVVRDLYAALRYAA